ncbi:MAG: uncharacterized protein QOE64_1729 [Frankiales bacterium]|jgi:predicted GNAT family acetyltransferase|nr:uncharacterized protein [Frankiales bacterium]
MSEQPPGEPSVTDNAELSRYEIRLDGVMAGYSEYVGYPDRRVITHTVIDPEFEGHGLGSALARGLLEDIRARGMRVVATCPFVRSYLQRHEGEYYDLLGRA